jgi:hypothetical protein
MILAIWISVGVIVVLVATFGIVLYDDWLWRQAHREHGRGAPRPH